MANYYSPTVIQQMISNADMTPLERLLLARIFDAESEGDETYFYSEDGPATTITLSRAKIETAFAASKDAVSALNDYVAKRLADSSLDDGMIDLELDATSGDISWEFILQDVVRRSPTLRYITAVSSFMCSKMRPDAFGGIVVLITADKIMGKSTNDIIEDWFDELGLNSESAKAANKEKFEALMPDGSRLPWDERLRTAGALMVPKNN